MSFLSAFKSNKQDENKEELLNEIQRIGKMIYFTDIWFDDERDNDLITSCIYQRESLINRYNYLINKAKRENIKNNPKIFKR